MEEALLSIGSLWKFLVKEMLWGSFVPTWINFDTGTINFVPSTPIKKIKLIEIEWAISATFIMNYLMIVTICPAVSPKVLLIFEFTLIFSDAFDSQSFKTRVQGSFLEKLEDFWLKIIILSSRYCAVRALSRQSNAKWKTFKRKHKWYSF